jgi:hypothetical protein
MLGRGMLDSLASVTSLLDDYMAGVERDTDAQMRLDSRGRWLRLTEGANCCRARRVGP